MVKYQTGLHIALSVLISPLVLTLSDVVSASTLPSIIISPEWSDIDLQLSPSTVNIFSSQQLDTAGAQGTQELQNIAPGLVFTSSAGVGQAYLRGVGGTVSAAGSPRVATFLDGVYLPRAVQSMQAFFDTKRVEVIKGPHGVHLGRNVVGGAVSIITQDPQPYREANVDVLYGISNQRQLRGAVNLPLNDVLSLRVAGILARRDGYSRNVFLDKDMDNQDYYAWRGKLRYRPSNDLDVIFSVEQNQQDDSRGIAPQPNPDIGVNGGVALGGVVPSNPREVAYNVDQNQNNSSDLYHAKVSWHTERVELQSITAYQKTKQDHRIDLDGTNVDFASNFPSSVAESYSQEFRLSSSRQQALNWVTGIYLWREDARQQLDVRFPLTGIENKPVSTAENSSYALFGELNYMFTDKWQGRVGVRQNHDEVELDMSQTIVSPAGVNTVSFQDRQHWQATTPEIGLTFNADADTFYYGKISRGYKAGGYNTYAIQPSYNPEFMWAYEAGIKAGFPDKQLRLNTALFYYDYSDMQLLTLPVGATVGTLPIITNAARSTIKGLDLQAWYRPLMDLEINMGVTLLDAYFKEFNSVDPNNPLSSTNRSGDPLPAAPKASLTLGVDYQWVYDGNGELHLSANYKYQSAVYFNPYHDEAVRQDSYGLINASLSYSSYRNNWNTELYVKNLTDELYAQNIIRIDPIVGTSRYWGNPRTFGFSLGYKF